MCVTNSTLDIKHQKKKKKRTYVAKKKNISKVGVFYVLPDSMVVKLESLYYPLSK